LKQLKTQFDTVPEAHNIYFNIKKSVDGDAGRESYIDRAKVYTDHVVAEAKRKDEEYEAAKKHQM